MSARVCGCDDKAGWVCERHREDVMKDTVPAIQEPASMQCGGGAGSAIPFDQFPVGGAGGCGSGTVVASGISKQETRITDAKTGGQKGSKLCQMGAVDPKAISVIGDIAGFGASKYERYNFAKGYRWSLSYDALQRHLMAFWGGENLDSESGLPHLGHAAWHCLALLTFWLRGKGTDDRFPV